MTKDALAHYVEKLGDSMVAARQQGVPEVVGRNAPLSIGWYNNGRLKESL